MSSSGLYQFNPAASDLTLQAFSRIGVRRTAITTEHTADADAESNLLQVEMGNKVPNLWRQELYSQTLTQGTATYTLPARTIAIRDAYLTVTSGGVSTDRLVWALTTFQYDAQPDKTQQSVPNCYWVDKQITPTVTVWPVADGNATYVLKMRLLTQMQDVSNRSGLTLDMPYRFLDVYVAGMAHRLSRIYARDQEALRKADYLDAWANAAQEDTEDNTQLLISPDMSGYFR